jgi:transposase-like protein
MELDLAAKSCVNPKCEDYGKNGLGNIGTRGRYGKAGRPLLYCKTCGRRFAPTHGTAMFGMKIPLEQVAQVVHHAAEGVGVRATARLLEMDKNTVNRIVLHAGEHCAKAMESLLNSLGMNETQLDELWAFVKKKGIRPEVAESSGYGRQSRRRHASS